MYIGTIHAYCQRILGDIDPTYRQYDVLDENRLKLYLISRYPRLELQNFRRPARASTGTLTPSNRLRMPGRLPTMSCLIFVAVSTEDQGLGDLLVRIQDGLRTDQYLDFSSMIRNVVEAIRNSEPGIANCYWVLEASHG